MAEAVSPPPDGGYPGGNTAEGYSALLSLTSGVYNTASGIYSLQSLTAGNFCTGVGAGTLLFNADENTATGAGALLSNLAGTGNTADGAFALFNNVRGLVPPTNPLDFSLGASTLPLAVVRCLATQTATRIPPQALVRLRKILPTAGTQPSVFRLSHKIRSPTPTRRLALLHFLITPRGLEIQPLAFLRCITTAQATSILPMVRWHSLVTPKATTTPPPVTARFKATPQATSTLP
jgi:hypothetical protein